MSTLKLPVSFKGEYRGVAREWEPYPDKETGEIRPGGRALKFEYETPDGLIAEIVVSEPKLDKAADFDVAKLQRGVLVDIVGVVSDGKYGMRFDPTSVRKATEMRRAA